MAGKDLGVHVGLLQTRGDWRGVCISLLGSEEMLLEMSSDKFTWVAFCFQGCNTGCCLERPCIKNREFVSVQRASGIWPSTLLHSPRVSVDTVMIEWLHTMDQGVLGDIIGSSNNSGCGITLHALHLGSCARAQEGELLLESAFCASQQLQ